MHSFRLLTRKYREIISRSPFGFSFKYYCNCCNHRVMRFLPYGAKSPVYSKHKIIGGGYRTVRCPICGSVDRYRWFLYVLKSHTTIFQNSCAVLHFAPEPEISVLLRNSDNIHYFTGDIEKGNADCVIDITDIPFKDESFDYIIANHVLSYVEKEDKAIYEMKRCIKPEGKIILSFPICTDLNTYEDYHAKDQGMDLELFGTLYNVRMYGKDYKERLEKYGLTIKSFSPENELSIKKIEHLKLMKDDIVLICEKKN